MLKSARHESNFTRSCDNAFVDLSFEEVGAQVLALRVDSKAQLEKTTKARKMTQVAASRILGISLGWVSDLSRGKVDKFSLDRLAIFAARVGKPAKLELTEP